MNNIFMDDRIKVAIPISYFSPLIHSPSDKAIIYWLNYLMSINIPWKLDEVIDAHDLFDHTDYGIKFYIVSIIPEDVNRIEVYIEAIKCCYELPDAFIIEDYATRGDSNIKEAIHKTWMT